MEEPVQHNKEKHLLLFAGLDCEVEEPAAPTGHQGESSIVSNMAAQLQAGNPEDRVCGLQSLANLTRSGGVRQLVLEAGLPIKNLPKKPTENDFLGFFGFFLGYNFLFFMKIIQTFLFETDFYEQIRHKLSFIYQKNSKVPYQELMHILGERG